MLFAYFGTDVVGVRTKANAFLHTREREGVVRETLSAEMCGENTISELAWGATLFGGPRLYVLDMLSEDEVVFEALFKDLTALRDSMHTFVLIEGKLLAPEKKQLEKYAEESVEVNAKAVERFNAFSLADALADRDKKRLWMLLVSARNEGLSTEEIIGTLYWQVKSMRLVEKTKSAEEAGMKDYPYNKAKRALARFSTEEVDTLARDLLSLYHDAHGGVRDGELALEAWVLKL